MVLAVPVPARAQSGSAIAGVVKDASGAVMPGVSVEAASPALIEKVRYGRHRRRRPVQDRQPRAGPYPWSSRSPASIPCGARVSSSRSSFTATVNAEMRLGALEETITVSGASPTVDTQNVVQQQVMTARVLNAIPAGMKSTGQIGVLIPGVTSTSQDVGGTAFSAVGLAVHGSRLNEQAALYDG
jgi:hypothetical protein